MARTAQAADAALVDEYLAWCVEVKHRSPTTVYTYRRDFLSLLRWMHDEGLTLRTVSTQDLERWLGRPRMKARGGQVAPATVRREMFQLRALWKWLVRRQQVTADPTLELVEGAPRLHNDDPKPIDPLSMWCDLWFSDVLDDSERVFLGLGFFCGLRRAEIVGLSPQQVGADGWVSGVLRKCGKRQGFPYLSAVRLYEERLPELIGDGRRLFLEPLRRLRVERRGRPALLPWAEERNPAKLTYEVHVLPDGCVNPDLANRRLIRMLTRARLPGDAFTPHQLRHSFVTNLVDAGVSVEVVSALAGHSSLDMTRRYMRLREDPLAAYVGDGGGADGPPSLRFRNRWGGVGGPLGVRRVDR